MELEEGGRLADLFRRKDVEMLMAPREGSFVSVFLPNHRMGPSTEQHPVRLKNQLAQAESRLIDEGLGRPVARELLAPAVVLRPRQQEAASSTRRSDPSRPVSYRTGTK